MIAGPHQARLGWALIGLALVLSCARPEPLGRVVLSSTMEDRLPDGSLYTADTQSLLRGSHWLENVSEVELTLERGEIGSLRLAAADEGRELVVANLPLGVLVPRLHYRAASPPDEFDAFNLMMAEYSRNGLSVPNGHRGDRIAHFRSDLDLDTPWFLEADYQFVPNPNYRPLRVTVVNNCLDPGLWELAASDRAGEIYHGWFSFPLPAYRRLVARVNGVEEAFVEGALRWRPENVVLDLARLRERSGPAWAVAPRPADRDGGRGFSSQESRRKLARGFVRAGGGAGSAVPRSLAELTAGAVTMTAFVRPGKYALDERREFDLTFLGRPLAAEVAVVRPLTHYRWLDADRPPDRAGETHLELEINFGDRRIVAGNLPMSLLVQQEDFVIHGFGVGILPASDLAEKRRFLIERGPAPSYAFLVEEHDGARHAINSHDTGIEQLFIRTRPFGAEPHWEITLSSYERIVDLARYVVPIPAELREAARASSREYVSPLYFSYRDDNVR